MGFLNFCSGVQHSGPNLYSPNLYFHPLLSSFILQFNILLCIKPPHMQSNPHLSLGPRSGLGLVHCRKKKNKHQLHSSSIHQDESNRALQRGNQTSHLPKPG